MQRRRRVALFANGWTKECLQELGYGISKVAREADVDIFAYVDYSVLAASKEDQMGEFNIFLLPDLNDFDGVFLMPNSFNLPEESEYLCRKISETGIPALSLEYDIEGLDYLGSENITGMRELVEHMIKEHKVKDILFVAGIKGHTDSETRLKVVLDVARENNIEIGEDNIIYANWSDSMACDKVGEWIKKRGSLPEAIICANDIMAIGLCKWLKAQGYKIPRDVKITGYDCIIQGQQMKPGLTTVTRDWSSMGRRAMEIMLDKLDGKKTAPKEVFKSRMVCGESCGCYAYNREDADDGESERIGYKKYDWMVIDQHYRHMYMALRKVETLDDAHGSMSYFFNHANMVEGKYFALYLHPSFFIMQENEDVYKEPGYGDEVNAVCSLYDNVPQECRRITTKEAMFNASEHNENPGIYIFSPLRNDDKNLGFVMVTDSFDIISDYMLYIWTRHVNQYIEQIRANVKIAELNKRLEMLSVTDVLTGLYNRRGCESVLYTFLDECQKRGGCGVMLLVDVDRMKTINDEYGHDKGDIALQTVAAVLKADVPKGFMAGRFGGDEFIVVGECDKSTSVEEIAERLSGQLLKEANRRKLTFPLSMSVGGVRLSEGEEFNLNECLQRADSSMYSVKAKHHEKIDAKA